jgi:hypothetical protein
MNEFSIIGLPGLYQNWLRAALDPECDFSLDLDHNFLCKKSKYEWIKKIEVDFLTAKFSGTTVNTYVNDQNFVWFLYNFLEKTDGVGILVNCLIEDLESKSSGTVAFNFMFKHFSASYDINNHKDHQYRNNAIIEYFYFLLLDQHGVLKSQCRFTDASFINIEYADFENKNTLKNKLSNIKLFDVDHFDRMYMLLYQRNKRYLTLRQNFVNKIFQNNRNFDILETAYIGTILTNSQMLDWFNQDVRDQTINERWSDICVFANNLLQ